jgi:hypothetical protein
VGIPKAGEAAPYYFRYIDRVTADDVVGVLADQLDDTTSFLSGFSEEQSLYRYAPGKWSARDVLGHVVDTELLFVARAFWFARGFDTPLPSFDEKPCVESARADDFSWSSHVDRFRATRAATLGFYRNLPSDAWARGGVASGNPFTVRALAYIVAGHLLHHRAVLEERYRPGA